MTQKLSVAVTDEVRTRVNRADRLTAEEEKALRMRHGAKVDPASPLPRAHGGDAELADELLLIEMQLLKAWRLRLKLQAHPPTGSKQKIVRALRKKK